jgi:hypothetical protein
MANEHIQDLEALRRVMVEQRRRLVRDLTAPQERGGAQDLREMFIKVQATIEAIDRALKDEQAS